MENLAMLLACFLERYLKHATRHFDYDSVSDANKRLFIEMIRVKLTLRPRIYMD